MALLWIVERNPRRRAALARLANASEEAVLGAPGDPRFETARPPDLVVLGLDGDWELELQFAHTAGRRAAGARWLLIGAPQDEAAALASFDTRIAEFLAYPPRSSALRAHSEARPIGAVPPSLSQRLRREAVSTRFARGYGDLDLPDLMRALDPQLASVPILVCGEWGTGRSLVTHYIHLFGGTAPGGLAHVPCSEKTRSGDLVDALAETSSAHPTQAALTIWLEDVGLLPIATQRTVLSWLEAGPPPGAGRATLIRWIATTSDRDFDRIDPALRIAVSGLSLQLPVLRDRPNSVRRIVAETTQAWCEARQVRTRRFGEDAFAVMEEYPWPGNLRELEAVVVQSLAATTSDPLRSDDLQLEGRAFSPLNASEIGSLIDENGDPPQHADRVRDDDLADILDERLSESPSDPPILTATPADEAPLVRLVESLSHEVRNPLATIRTFAELLPERFGDPEFRDRFAAMLREDVGRIDGLVKRLAGVARLPHPEIQKVDVTALLEELLDEHRARIREQRLLVLKELDTSEPQALCDAEQLRFALDTLLEKALSWVPPQGDVYLASRHHPAGAGRGPSVRVLLRFHNPPGSAPSQTQRTTEGSLELMIAEIVVRGQGGTLSVAATEGDETVILLDLPAP